MGLPRHLHEPVSVAGQVTHGGVELRQYDLHATRP
jgi:hypothetical protein